MSRPRDAEHTVQVIAWRLEVFLEAVAEAGDGAGLPKFVEREFREFLLCGVFEGGVSGIACRSSGPPRSTREEAADVHCGSGSWGPLGRPVSDSGRLCHGEGGHDGGEQRRSVLMLTSLPDAGDHAADVSWRRVLFHRDAGADLACHRALESDGVRHQRPSLELF